jgi:hypothetical protein
LLGDMRLIEPSGANPVPRHPLALQAARQTACRLLTRSITVRASGRLRHAGIAGIIKEGL